MRTIRMLSSALLVGTMAVVTPGGAASAATDTTYAGVFGGGIVYKGCTQLPDPATTGGSWSIVLKRTSTNGTVPSAKGTFDILVNGLPHVSYVFPNMEIAAGGPNTTLVVSGMTDAGLLTVTVKDSGKMTYTIAPYSFYGRVCDSVTYPGHT